MMRNIVFEKEGGEKVKLFLFDTTTGNSAVDILTVPGVYEQVASQQPLYLEKLTGSIGSYKTSLFGLVCDYPTESQDDTTMMSSLLSLPSTAAKAVMSTLGEEEGAYAEKALQCLRFYENIKPGDRLCISKEGLVRLPEELRDSMVSVRKSYILKSVDNQEIFQKSYEAEFGLQLPSLEDIHGSEIDDLISALDILRVSAPYRREERQGVYAYRSIYHTPYFKVDARLRGMIPTDMDWIGGRSSNDMLGFQSNERHMINNLKTLICADLSRYVVEMVSGIFFNTDLGSALSRLIMKADRDVIHHLCQDINARGSDDVSCNLIMSDIDTTYDNGWSQHNVVDIIKKSLKMSDGYLRNLIQTQKPDGRVIMTENLPFTLSLTDTQEQEFTELLISMGYISSALRDFLVRLCICAYRVHWGHTGATRAVPGFMDRTVFPNLDAEIARYLGDVDKGQQVDAVKYPELYTLNINEEENEDDSVFDDSTSNKEEMSMRMDFYVTTETVQKINMDSLDPNYFTTKASGAQSAEAAIVEYWRTVNGESNLEMFISTSLLNTADVDILIECFIKLMRWGERKPKLLVFQDHADIRYVFDLSTGQLISNTVIVDESTLVLHNGCEYSLKGFLCTQSNSNLPRDRVIGFLLQKDYGTVQKNYLASWVDLGEIVSSNANVIGDFSVLTPITLDADKLLPIEEFDKAEHSFYLSDSNIEEGLKLKIPPKELSALALLTTSGIATSAGYLKSLANDRIITTKDRQYECLRKYLKVMDNFYGQHKQEILEVQNSMSLSALATIFYDMWKNYQEGKADSNTVTANANLNRLNLGGPVRKFDNTELVGSFYLITDVDFKSTFPPIEFTDKQVRAVAAMPQARNRIVLLLLIADNKFIFCRKDISALEVMRTQPKVPGGKPGIGNRRYKDLAPVVEGLLEGRPMKINGKPAVLHKSLEEFV